MYRAPLVLASICLVATLALGLLRRATKARISALEAKAELRAFYTLLMRHTQGPQKPIPQAALYALQRLIEGGRAAENTSEGIVQTQYVLPKGLLEILAPPALAGATAKAEAPAAVLRMSGRGYGGPLRLLAAYREGGSLYHAVLLPSNETPGLGKRAEDPQYMQMFWELDSALITNAGAGAQLNAVSGATITFAGVERALHAGARYIKGED